MAAANAAVARIMRIARELGGVISGEHGIGITKLEYLTDSELAPFRDYKQRIDPNGHFNHLAPGTAFRTGGAPFLRLCFARSPEDIAEAARRIAKWLAR